MRTRHLTPALLITLALAAMGSLFAADDSTVDIEIGYQAVDVDGNEDMFRTLVNEDDGLVLHDLSLTTRGGELFDVLRVDASGFGGNPAGRLRLFASSEQYRLSFGYSHLQLYNALPAFANPLLDEGILPGQHSYERERDLVNLELQLFPGRTFSPLIGYRWNRADSDRHTTRHMGEDEFLLTSDSTETEKEAYIGVVFTHGGFSGTVIQGWRSFSGRDRLHLAPDAGDGNLSRPVLGEDVSLNAYDRQVHTDVDTPVTTARLDGRVGDRTRLKATFSYADAESEVSGTELLSGSLVSFNLARLFAGLDETVESRTEHPSWRGELAGSFDLSSVVTLDAAYQVRDRSLDGWALISSLYLDTLSFSGLDQRDITQVVNASTRLERTDSVASLRLQARELGPVTLWAEYTLNDQEVELWEDVAEIVVPGAQEGRFERQVDGFAAGLAVHAGDVDAALEWRTEDADTAVVRTDFLERDRLRLRLGWKLADKVKLVASAETIDSSNPLPQVRYDLSTDHYALQLLVTPMDELTLHLGYDTYTTDSTAIIRRPEDFTTMPSIHSEDGDMIEGGLTWTKERFTLDIGYSSYENSGSLAYQLDRAHGRATYDINDTYGLAVELETWDYSEDFFAPADFDATRYGLFLRLRL